MLPLTPQSRIFVAVPPVDFRKGIGTPGHAWRLQQVQFLPRQEVRAPSPGIESWAYGGNDMSQVETERCPGRTAREAIEPRDCMDRRPTESIHWKAIVSVRYGQNAG